MLLVLAPNVIEAEDVPVGRELSPRGYVGDIRHEVETNFGLPGRQAHSPRLRQAFASVAHPSRVSGPADFR